MISPENAFYSPDLHRIHRGEISLRAPVLNGVVQVGAIEHDGLTRLNVSRDGQGIHIARDDDELLQVEVNIPVAYQGLQAGRTVVFDQPIETVIFTERTIETVYQDEQNRDWVRWVAEGDGVAIASVPAVQQFVRELSIFVSGKQEAQYRRLRVRKTARSFMLRHGLMGAD